MKKTTDKQIKEIRKLFSEGLSYAEIGRRLNLSDRLVTYYCLNPEQKNKRIKKQQKTFLEKPLKERQKIYKKKQQYLKKYLNHRYNTDKEFRQKIRDRQKKKNVK